MNLTRKKWCVHNFSDACLCMVSRSQTPPAEHFVSGLFPHVMSREAHDPPASKNSIVLLTSCAAYFRA